MKLTYRGTNYKTSVERQQISVQFQQIYNSVDQSTVELIYRGNSYRYLPPSIAVHKVDVADNVPEFLTYRGITHMRRLYPFQIRKAIA